MRDPYFDPQQGDILRTASGKRERHVLARHGGKVVYQTVTKDHTYFSTEIRMDTWQAWCRQNRATVIQA